MIYFIHISRNQIYILSIGCIRVSEVPHWIKIKRMSNKYNIIEHIPIGFKPFRLKCISICYINYSKKPPKMFISPTLCDIQTCFFFQVWWSYAWARTKPFLHLLLKQAWNVMHKFQIVHIFPINRGLYLHVYAARDWYLT